MKRDEVMKRDDAGTTNHSDRGEEKERDSYKSRKREIAVDEERERHLLTKRGSCNCL